ncbi:MAG: DUF342 domain-containing protein [Desulfobulbaceae bacterium]|nr:DUF342 domain-containing protein [Desulfobulbaceae bacterium]
MHRETYFFHISPDFLHVTLHSAGMEGEAVKLGSSEELDSLLLAKGVIYGLDPAVIACAATFVDRAEPLDAPLLLAAGIPPFAAIQGMRLQFAVHPLTFEETDENGQVRQSQIALSPLARVGDVLVQNGPPVPDRPGKNVFGRIIPAPVAPEQVFLPGDNVTFDPEKQQLTASVSGYPVVNTKKKGMVAQLTVSIEKLVKVTSDRMQAILLLKPTPPGESLPDLEMLRQIFDEEGLSFGRMPNAVGQCLAKAAEEVRPQQAVIALGTLPVNGKDAWLRFVMEIGPLPGKILGNGEIDFRERNMFIGVNKDQLIAVKIPPTEGTPGRDIFGYPVAPVPGSDIIINVSDDAAFDAVTGEIRATRAGVLSKVSEGSVKVCSRQIIAQNVDFETGNINSNDALEIKGSIMPKFKVNALGDILVCGTVEKAQVKSGGNVVVQGGLIGDLSDIHAKGDVDITITEHGRIFAEGSIILRKSAFSSRLAASGDIHCDSSSRVIHSQLIAAGSITAGRVGSDNAEPSLLAAAVSPAQMQLFFDMHQLISAKKKEIEALKMRQGPNAWSDKLDELTVELEEVQKKLTDLNLICSAIQRVPDNGLSHALQCIIAVRGKIFEGTEIRIGNRRMVLEKTMSNIQFQLQDHLAAVGGRTKSGIIATPLTK